MHTVNETSRVARTPAMPEKTVEVPCAWAAAGLYLPSIDPGHAAHELTQKIRAGKVSRRHDREFADLLAATLATRLGGFTPDLVISIPQRPTQEDRFRHIRRLLASRAGATDGEAALSQTRVVHGYRQMTVARRRACCPGRFAAPGGVRGKDLLLIDDVITSGAQATDAVRALRAAGAGTVAFLAIARATRAPEDPLHPRRPRGRESPSASRRIGL